LLGLVQNQRERRKAMEKTIHVLSNWKHSFLLILLPFFLVGCGAGKTLVMKPPATKVKVSSVDFSEEGSTVNVPEKIRRTFQEKLSKVLFKEGTFQKGSDLEIVYRFIQYDPGNQFTRWFWGGIGNAGEGTLTIEAKFFDAHDKELSVIQVEGKIGSGFFGGSFDLALEKAANEIVEYLQQHYQ
jgi:hypothetical protein